MISYDVMMLTLTVMILKGLFLFGYVMDYFKLKLILYMVYRA